MISTSLEAESIESGFDSSGDERNIRCARARRINRTHGWQPGVAASLTRYREEPAVPVRGCERWLAVIDCQCGIRARVVARHQSLHGHLGARELFRSQRAQVTRDIRAFGHHVRFSEGSPTVLDCVE